MAVITSNCIFQPNRMLTCLIDCREMVTMLGLESALAKLFHLHIENMFSFAGILP